MLNARPSRRSDQSEPCATSDSNTAGTPFSDLGAHHAAYALATTPSSLTTIHTRPSHSGVVRGVTTATHPPELPGLAHPPPSVGTGGRTVEQHEADDARAGTPTADPGVRRQSEPLAIAAVRRRADRPHRPFGPLPHGDLPGRQPDAVVEVLPRLPLPGTGAATTAACRKAQSRGGRSIPDPLSREQRSTPAIARKTAWSPASVRPTSLLDRGPRGSPAASHARQTARFPCAVRPRWRRP